MLKAAFRVYAPGLLAIAALAQQTPPDPAIVMGRLDGQLAPLATAWLQSTDPRLQALLHDA